MLQKLGYGINAQHNPKNFFNTKRRKSGVETPEVPARSGAKGSDGAQEADDAQTDAQFDAVNQKCLGNRSQWLEAAPPEPAA